MNDKRKALGRGLEQLFNDEGLNFDTIENSIIEEAKTNDQIVEIDLSELRANPYQPRKNFDEEALNELASSIKEQTLLMYIPHSSYILNYLLFGNPFYILYHITEQYSSPGAIFFFSTFIAVIHIKLFFR